MSDRSMGEPRSALQKLASAYPLMWRVKVIHPEWFGRPCRIVIHGGKGNRLIEFDNGERVVCPGQYLRKRRVLVPPVDLVRASEYVRERGWVKS